MEPFVKHNGVVAPLNRSNVDTDQIIPAVYLKSIERTGFGDFLFAPWRYNSDGSPNNDFMLNDPKYQDATILVGGNNFGCGSSREHAPWALHDYGFRCVIAPSFADIFYNNCFKNGLLPVRLPDETARLVMDHALANPGSRLNVDLEAQRIWSDDEVISISFDVDPARRRALLHGLDDIGLTLQFEDRITAYEAAHGS